MILILLFIAALFLAYSNGANDNFKGVATLIGSGVVAVGNEFNFSKLFDTFFIPLIVSPLLAAILSLVLYLVFRKARLHLRINKDTCLCLEDQITNEYKIAIGGAAELNRAGLPSLSLSEQSYCSEQYSGKILGINSQVFLDKLHFLSSGVVSFSRGLNDTPKIVGLLLLINTLNVEFGMIAVAIAMALGGLFNAKKVGRTVAQKITPMNSGQGFTANLITGILVTTASIHGLPVSTTHVSVGSIFGISTVNKKADISTIKNIFFSWVLTLPAAAVFSSLVYLILTMN